MVDVKAGGISLNITPKIDWSALHGELAAALRDELRHIVAKVSGRKCPVCG